MRRCPAKACPVLRYSGTPRHICLKKRVYGCHCCSLLAEFSGYGGYVGYFGPVMVGRGQTLAMQHIPPPTTAAAKHSMVSSAKVVVGERVVSTTAHQ